MINKLFDSSLARFLLVGMGNTLLSATLMFLLEGVGYWRSTAIAYGVGAVMSFFLNRSFTFRSKESVWKTAAKFALSVAVCYVIGYGLARLIIPVPGRPYVGAEVWIERGSKLLGMCFYTGFNYLGQRFFTFPKADKNYE